MNKNLLTKIMYIISGVFLLCNTALASKLIIKNNDAVAVKVYIGNSTNPAGQFVTEVTVGAGQEDVVHVTQDQLNGKSEFYVSGDVGGDSSMNKCTKLLVSENHKVAFNAGHGGVVCTLDY